MNDPEAFWARHRQEAFHLALLLAGSREAADEVVQEAWVELLRSRGRFDPSKGSERAWFLGILRHKAQRLARSGRRKPLSLDLPIFATLLAVEEGEGDPVERREELAALLKSLEVLPEDQREAVSCRWILGWNNREMAEAWGLTPEAARQRAHRGLILLREALAKKSDKSGHALRRPENG